MKSTKPDQRPALSRGHWYRFNLTPEPHGCIPAGLDFAGNYAIFLPDGRFYIGESGNVSRRLRQHIRIPHYSALWKTPWGRFKTLEIAVRKERSHFERMMIEARLIERLKPVLNKSRGRWIKYG